MTKLKTIFILISWFVPAGAAGSSAPPPPPATVREMDVHELADILIAAASPAGPQQLDSTMDAQQPLWQLLDVREVNEYNIAKLPGFTLLPTSAFSEWAPQVTASPAQLAY